MAGSGNVERRVNELWIQRRYLVIGVVVVLVSSGLLFLGATSFWQTAQSLRVSVEQSDRELAQVEQRAALLNAITPDDKNAYLMIQQALPRFKEPLKILRTLEAISLDAQVGLGEYDVNPGLVSTEAAQQVGSSRRRTTSASGTETLRLEIELTGTFDQVSKAVENIETSLPLMDILDLRITPSRRSQVADTSTIQYTATLQIQSYYVDFTAKQVTATGAQQVTPGQRAAREAISTMQVWVDSTPEGQQATGSGDLFQLSQ